MKMKNVLSLLFFLAFPTSVTASDVCTDPTDLPINSGVLVGSASVIVTDDDVPGCSFVDGLPTAWYQVVGTGNFLTLSTCSSETQSFTVLNVLVGDDCTELDCAGIREISGRNCQETNLASIVGWSSVEGQVYRILVSTEQVGDIFGLTVTEQVPPSNDMCNAAIAVLPDNEDPVVGNTALASPGDIQDTCGAFETSRAIWYTVQATTNSSFLTATTCTPETTFDTSMSVFVGDDCSDLKCVGFNDDVVAGGECGEKSTLTWPAELGETYYMLIGGFRASSVGTFGLQVQEDPSGMPSPPNDVCENAIASLDSGRIFLVEGSLLGANSNQLVSTACENVPGYTIPESASSVWYYLRGTGNMIEVSTCTDVFVLDTQISVLMGDNCTEFTCVGGNDDDAACDGGASTFSWETELGQLYYVVVHADPSSPDFGLGNFALTVEEIVPPDNDLCEDAIDIVVTGGSLLVGSTLDTTAEDNACASDNSTTRGVWYTILGNGRVISASTCSNITNYDTLLDVFGGDSCSDDLECVARGTQDMECDYGGAQVVSWMSSPEETYYLFVHGKGITGTFSLTVIGEDREVVPSNDMCMNAIGLLIDGGVTATGSTVSATIDTGVIGSAFCGTEIDASGVWYYVDGEGRGMRASTCSENTAYDTAISVFTTGEEEGCGDLICIGGDDDDFNCGDNQSASSVAWASETGRRYYILVHGGKSAVGDFGLTVATFERVQNDQCSETADAIPSDGSVIIGSTIKATIDEAARAYHCGAFVGVGAGVWYRVIGTGELFTASTCSSETDFNTALSVFTGLCGFDNLTCVGGNDDTYFCDEVPYGASEYSWQTTQDDVYYILVHASSFADLGAGFLSAYGTFGLAVTAEALPPV